MRNTKKRKAEETAARESAETIRKSAKDLDAAECDVMILRFVKQWEYHEIAAARANAMGTIQWRIFNSKKKLAGHLMPRRSVSAGQLNPSVNRRNRMPRLRGLVPSRLGKQTGALKKNGPQAIGKSRGGWNTKIHMVAADARTAITFALSPGNAHDAPEGRELLKDLGPMPEGLPLLMDRAYEGNETRQLVLDLGMVPVVPPKSNRLHPWDYDHAVYKKRNEIDRLFRRLKGFRRIFSRFEKLDVLFLGFLSFALIVEALRVV